MNTQSGPKRLWMPIFGSLLIIAGCLAYFYGIAAGKDRLDQVMTIWIMGMALIAWNALWLIGFSGLSWSARFLTLLAVAGGATLLFLFTVRKIHYDGDLGRPNITWKWEPTREEIVRQHREKHLGKMNLDRDFKESPDDFPEYRGRKRDGVVTGPALLRDWSSPPKKLWQQPCGEGYSGFAVVGDTCITIEQRGNDEAVVAYHAPTGQELWVLQYPTRFSETLGGDGPRATPTIHGDQVYAVGAGGRLTCLRIAEGTVCWSKDILENNKNIPWGMAGSPLVDDRLVIVNPGCQDKAAEGRALVAFDRTTGKEVWNSGDTQAGYSSLMFATLSGVRQVILLDGVEFAGYAAADGKKLWSAPYENDQKINVAQPLVLSDDRLFVSTSYRPGEATMFQVRLEGESWKVEKLWRNRLMRCKFTSPVEHEGYLYGLDEGILVCLDAKTGNRTWKGERFGHGQLLRHENLLVIFAETGFLALVEANPKEFHEITRMQVFDELKNWNPFALARGKVYLRNHKEMAAYDLTTPDASAKRRESDK